MLIISNNKLTADEKANLLRLISNANQHDDGSTTSMGAARAYDGLLTEVAAGSSDSEVEARRAGVILSARVCTKMVAEVWENDADKSEAEAKGDGEDVDEEDEEDKAEGEGEGEAEGEGNAGSEG
jgi:hypothetical protein